MKTSSSIPTVTKKWHIEVPTHQYESLPSLYKVWFGTHYFIWKGKSLLQSCQYLAEGIERYIRFKKDIDTDYLYHVCNHIKRTRCQKATVEVLANDFTKSIKDVESINGYALLVAEQTELDKAVNDPLCLNNNYIAHVPGWISKPHQEKFENYLQTRKKPRVK